MFYSHAIRALWSIRHGTDNQYYMSEYASPAAREFGERLRAQRLKLGISQETLAELSGMHWTAVGKLERGQRNPSLHNIIRIAGGLDVDPALLVTGLSTAMLPQAPAPRSRAAEIRQRRSSGER